MGIEMSYSNTRQIRRILNLLAILEEKEGDIKNDELCKKLSAIEKMGPIHRDVISGFIKIINSWSGEGQFKIIKSSQGINAHDEIIERSPYKFNLNKSNQNSKMLYKEYLSIAFALLLIKNPNLNFIDEFLQKDKPLNILMKLLNSASPYMDQNDLNIEYQCEGEAKKVKAKFEKLSYDDQSGIWCVVCSTDSENVISINLLDISTVSPVQENKQYEL